MNCTLASTGTDLAWVPVVVLALAIIVVGILLAVKGRRAAPAVIGLLVLCATAALVTAGPTAAYAACSSPLAVANSLTVEQTSINTGLAPDQAPSMIVGRVVNNGPDETLVTAVTASIAFVVKAASAVAGPCDATDYVLLDVRMPVGEQLGADGGSASFSGARIGFLDKPGNQDACKGAVVGLHYSVE